MEVSGQLHLRGDNPQYLLDRRLGRAPWGIDALEKTFLGTNGNQTPTPQWYNPQSNPKTS
jgi:hypothetical protein